MRNLDWPEECGEKIGLRQNVITIEKVKYKNITETIKKEKIIWPEPSNSDFPDCSTLPIIVLVPNGKELAPTVEGTGDQVVTTNDTLESNSTTESDLLPACNDTLKVDCIKYCNET